MTIANAHPCPDGGQLRDYLKAVAARLAAEGIACRVTHADGTLTVEQPGPRPVPTMVYVDAGDEPGSWVDCNCVWSLAPGVAPEAAADTIQAVLDAINSGQHERERP